MKKNSSSSARNANKSSRSEAAKKQHGMNLRSEKKESVEELCEIISHQSKRISSLEAQNKRLQADVAAKDKKIEEMSALAALHWEPKNANGTANESFQVYEDENPEDLTGEQPNDSGLPVGRTPFEELAIVIYQEAQTAAGEFTLEDPASTSFRVYEDQEDSVEEQDDLSAPDYYPTALTASPKPMGSENSNGNDDPLPPEYASPAVQYYPTSLPASPETVGRESDSDKENDDPLPQESTTLFGQRYGGPTIGPTAGRTVFGSSWQNVSPFNASPAAEYYPTSLTASPEMVKSESDSDKENDDRLPPEFLTVLTGRHMTDIMYMDNMEWPPRGTKRRFEDAEEDDLSRKKFRD